jgi:hypothetical protein
LRLFTSSFFAALSVFTFAVMAGCDPGEAGDRAPSEASAESAASAAASKPSAPVAVPETIRVRLTHAGGELDRVYVPVTVQPNGQAEHVILDSGTARTWFRLANATEDFTPNAFVAKIGASTLSVFGRDVPAFDESVDGRVVIGAIGVDLISAGPTVLDLRSSTLVRYPTSFVVPGSDTWPVMPIAVTRGLIHGHVTVDGVDHHVMVDTGSPTTLLIAQPEPGDQPRTSHDALGNPFTVYDGRGDLVIAPELGDTDVAVTRAPTFPHLTDIANALGLPIDGLLGLSSMGGRRVLFDLAAGVVRFEPKSP